MDIGLIQIIDSFLDDFEWFRSHCDQLDYSGTVNPVDGVEYPGISLSIPAGVAAEVIYKAERAIGKRILSNTMFLRLTTEGTDAPHQAHTDSSMGDYALMMYMTDIGGTSFVEHIETGLDKNPADGNEEDVWRRDTNTYDIWKVTEMVEAVPNRALIFEAEKMHRAEPPSGYGSNAKDGRLVLTCFMSIA